MITLYKNRMVNGEYSISEDDFKDMFDEYMRKEGNYKRSIERSLVIFVVDILNSMYDLTEWNKMLIAIRR